MSTFLIKANADGSVLFSGELVYSAITPGLWEQSKEILTKAAAAIAINLNDVTQCDSTGVAFIVSWVRLAGKQNKKLSLLNVPAQMRTIIHVSGLEKLLPIL